MAEKYSMKQNDVTRGYPSNVCIECAVLARRAEQDAGGRTFVFVAGIKLRTATCGVCLKVKKNTSSPDVFGWPKFPGHRPSNH